MPRALSTARARPPEPEVQHGIRLQAVLDTAVDGIILIAAKGSIMSFNPACERLFGYRPEEVIGRNVKMLMPPVYEAWRAWRVGSINRPTSWWDEFLKDPEDRRQGERRKTGDRRQAPRNGDRREEDRRQGERPS